MTMYTFEGPLDGMVVPWPWNKYSKNPYGRKKDGGVHQGPEGGAQGLTAPGVENNGFLDHTLPPDPSMLL